MSVTKRNVRHGSANDVKSELYVSRGLQNMRDIIG